MGNKNKTKAFRAPLRDGSEEAVKSAKKKDKSHKPKKIKSPPLMENVISSSGNVVEEQPLTGTSPKSLLVQNEPQPDDEAKLHNPSQGNSLDILNEEHGNELSKKKKHRKTEQQNKASASSFKMFSDSLSQQSDNGLEQKLLSILEGITCTNDTNIDKPVSDKNSEEPNTIENSESMCVVKSVKRPLEKEFKKFIKTEEKPKKKKKSDDFQISEGKKIKKKGNEKNKTNDASDTKKSLKTKKIVQQDTNDYSIVDSVINTDKDVAHSSELDKAELQNVSNFENTTKSGIHYNTTEDLNIEDLSEVNIFASDNSSSQNSNENRKVLADTEATVQNDTENRIAEDNIKNTKEQSNTENKIAENGTKNTDKLKDKLLESIKSGKKNKTQIDKLKQAEKVKKAEFWKFTKTKKENKMKENDLKSIRKGAGKTHTVNKIKKRDVTFKKGTGNKIAKKRKRLSQMMSQELLLKSSQYPMYLCSQPSRSLSHYERLLWLQQRRGVGLWVHCDQYQHGKLCNKLRYLPDNSDPTELPDKWYCSMHPDPAQASCSAKEHPPSLVEQEDMVNNLYTAGSIVWAQAEGYPWWPAMVDDCVDAEQYYWIDTCSDVPTQYNVVFFDLEEPTRCWLHLSKIQPMHSTTPPNGRNCRNRLYAKRIQHAIGLAMTAKKLSIKERLRKYSFLAVYNGDILTPTIVAASQESQHPSRSNTSNRSNKKRSGPKSKLEELSESLRTLICSLNPEENGKNKKAVSSPANDGSAEDSSTDNSTTSDSDEEVSTILVPGPDKLTSMDPPRSTKLVSQIPDLFPEGEQTEDVDVSNRATAGGDADDEFVCFSQRAKRNSEPSELKDLSDIIAIQKSLNPPSISGKLHKNSSGLLCSPKTNKGKKDSESTDMTNTSDYVNQDITQ